MGRSSFIKLNTDRMTNTNNNYEKSSRIGSNRRKTTVIEPEKLIMCN
jgi:hypothetical protein